MSVFVVCLLVVGLLIFAVGRFSFACKQKLREKSVVVVVVAVVGEKHWEVVSEERCVGRGMVGMMERD